MSYYDRLIQQGKTEGKAEGALEVLLKQLALKFGPLDPSVHERVARASIEQLDRMAERILTAATLEDVLG